MKNIVLVSAFSLAFALSGCDKSPTPSILTFEPPSLATCYDASVVIVKWNVRTKHPEVQMVSIYVTDGKSENIFAEGEAMGEAKTEQWVKPGLPTFIIKDKATGKILDKAAVSGPSCK